MPPVDNFGPQFSRGNEFMMQQAAFAPKFFPNNAPRRLNGQAPDMMMYPPPPRPMVQLQPQFQQYHHQQQPQPYHQQQQQQMPQPQQFRQPVQVMPSYAALGESSRQNYQHPRPSPLPNHNAQRNQGNGHGNHHNGSYKNAGNHSAVHGGFTDVNGSVYVVQFKNAYRYYMLDSLAPQHVSLGDFVVVDGDRGEDMGVVTDILSMMAFIEMKYMSNSSLDEEENTVGRILRIATVYERQQLPAKFHDEKNVVKYCAEILNTLYVMPMVVLDAEFQFDRHKLTIFYDATARIDFRELVRDLYSTYKTRIWMKQVETSRPFYPKQYAVMALATGVQFNPDRA